MWSKRRLQTLVASSDGKGEGEKQAPAFRKRSLMRTTRILRAKRDSDPLFPREPCQIFFFSTPLILSLYVIPSYQINSAQSGS